MRKKSWRLAVPLVVGLSAAASGASAAPIMIGATTFDRGLDAFPVAATAISGTPSSFSGTPGDQALIGADTNDGWFNMGASDVVRLDFGTPFSNEAGADLYFTDSRFSADSLDWSLDGTTYFTIAVNDFTDTGVDGVITNTTFPFDLFATTIDLSDFGFAAGGSFSSVWLQGTGQSDPVVVGVLNDDTTVIPTPAALPLLLGALGLLGILRRRRSAG